MEQQDPQSNLDSLIDACKTNVPSIDQVQFLCKQVRIFFDVYEFALDKTNSN